MTDVGATTDDHCATPPGWHETRIDPTRPAPTLAAFGQRVRALREAVGLRQADLAAKVGLARASIANIEAGRQDTTVTVLLALADTLGTTGGALLGETPGPSVPLSLLVRVTDQQRRIAGTLTEAGELVQRLAHDADEMRARMDALVGCGGDAPTEDTCLQCGLPIHLPDGRRWRHKWTTLAACPNGTTVATPAEG